jgi:hypothetical protein
LLVGHVDADDATRWPDLQRSHERVHARAAPQIDHGLTRLELSQVEEVAHAGE